MTPRGLCSRVYAMARPCRPDAERVAVLAAVGAAQGSASARAQRLAKLVAAAVLVDVDRDPIEHVFRRLLMTDPTPLELLIADPGIDTAGLVVSERLRRLEARRGRRLHRSEWPIEDAEVEAAVVATLSERYRRFLRQG